MKLFFSFKQAHPVTNNALVDGRNPSIFTMVVHVSWVVGLDGFPFFCKAKKMRTINITCMVTKFTMINRQFYGQC